MLTLKILFWLCIFLVAYTYVGYAFVLWLLVWIKRIFCRTLILLPLRNEDTLPDVTLMICAYNEEDIIVEKMENIRRLNYPSKHLCVM